MERKSLDTELTDTNATKPLIRKMGWFQPGLGEGQCKGREEKRANIENALRLRGSHEREIERV